MASTIQPNGNDNQPGPSQDSGNGRKDQTAGEWDGWYHYVRDPQAPEGHRLVMTRSSGMNNQESPPNNGTGAAVPVESAIGMEPIHEQNLIRESRNRPAEGRSPNSEKDQRLSQVSSDYHSNGLVPLQTQFHAAPDNNNGPPEASRRNTAPSFSRQYNGYNHTPKPQLYNRAQRGRPSNCYNQPRNSQFRNQAPPSPAVYQPTHVNNPEQRNPTLMWRMSDGAYVPVETMGYAIEQSVLTMTSVEQKLVELCQSVDLMRMEVSRNGKRIKNFEKEIIASRNANSGNTPVGTENNGDSERVCKEQHADPDPIRAPSITLPVVIEQMNDGTEQIGTETGDVMDGQEVGKQVDFDTDSIDVPSISSSEIVQPPNEEHEITLPDIVMEPRTAAIAMEIVDARDKVVHDVPVLKVVQEDPIPVPAVACEHLTNHVPLSPVVQSFGKSRYGTSSKMAEETKLATSNQDSMQNMQNSSPLDDVVNLQSLPNPPTVGTKKMESGVLPENTVFSNEEFPTIGQSDSGSNRSPTSNKTGTFSYSTITSMNPVYRRTSISSDATTTSFSPCCRRSLTLKDFLLPIPAHNHDVSPAAKPGTVTSSKPVHCVQETKQLVTQPIQFKPIKPDSLKPATAPTKNQKMASTSKSSTNATTQSKQAKTGEQNTPVKAASTSKNHTNVTTPKSIKVVKNATVLNASQVSQDTKVAVVSKVKDAKHVTKSTVLTVKKVPGSTKATPDPGTQVPAVPDSKSSGVVHASEAMVASKNQESPQIKSEQGLCQSGDVNSIGSSKTKSVGDDEPGDPAASDVPEGSEGLADMPSRSTQDETPRMTRKQRQRLEHKRLQEIERLARKEARALEQQELLLKATEKSALAPEEPLQEQPDLSVLVFEDPDEVDEDGRPRKHKILKKKLRDGPTVEQSIILHGLFKKSASKKERFNNCPDPLKYFRDRLASFEQSTDYDVKKPYTWCFEHILSSSVDIFKWHGFALMIMDKYDEKTKLLADLEYLEFIISCFVE